MILRHASLPAAFLDSAARHADLDCWRVRRDDAWQTWTYADAERDVRRLADALVEHGVQPGDRVAIFAANCPEWSIADLATLMAGGIVVTVFVTCNVDQATHILRDSGTTLCVVGGQREADVVAACDLPELRQVVAINPVEGLPTLADWSRDAGDQADEVARRLAAIDLEGTATIIYTSGTTGAPRGAEVAHRGYAHELAVIDDLWYLGPGESSVAFLPLAHALERVWTYYVMFCGALNTYCESPRTIAELLPLARPTTIISVPKLYEKVYAGAFDKVADSPVKRAILRWALHVGGRLQHQYRKGATPSWWLRAQLPLADRLVLSSIREAVGGPKTLLISGGAPLRTEIEEFFSAAGMLLGQGYGLTETGPMTTAFSRTSFKLGTVGKPIPGCEVRIGDGSEILLKGPHLMKGYWRNPEATAQVVDADGWFHTGDAGYLDEQGYMVITDRLKDIIVTIGGKNVAPQPLEGLLLTDPLFEYAVVLGDNRPYLTALLQPSVRGLEAVGRQLGLAWDSVEELLTHPHVVEEVRRRVSELQQRLPGFEQVRDVRLLRGLSLDEGTVTPTLKVRRKAVETKFADLIEEMYAKVRPR